jgi:hypothetical protein
MDPMTLVGGSPAWSLPLLILVLFDLATRRGWLDRYAGDQIDSHDREVFA